MDKAVHDTLQSVRSSALELEAEVLTHLGSGPVLAVIVLIAAVGFARAGRMPAAVVLVLASVLSSGFVEGFKEIVQRPRPTFVPHLWDSARASFSYPSGHAFNSAAVYLAIALIVGRGLSPVARRRLVLVAAALTGVIGLTRLILGAHFLTDVIGGWAGGIGWALLAAWLEQRVAPPIFRRAAS